MPSLNLHHRIVNRILLVAGQLVLLEFREAALIERSADLLHQTVVVPEVVDHAQAHAQHLICLQEMADVCTGEIPAGRTAAVLLDRPQIFLILRIEQVQMAAVRIDMAVTPVSRRIHAVEEIHAALHAFQYVGRSTNSHEIRRFVAGQVRHDRIQHAVHLLVGLPHGQAAHSVAVQVQLGDLLRVFNADILENGPLIKSSCCGLIVSGRALSLAISSRQRTSHLVVRSTEGLT